MRCQWRELSHSSVSSHPRTCTFTCTDNRFGSPSRGNLERRLLQRGYQQDTPSRLYFPLGFAYNDGKAGREVSVFHVRLHTHLLTPYSAIMRTANAIMTVSPGFCDESRGNFSFILCSILRAK